MIKGNRKALSELQLSELELLTLDNKQKIVLDIFLFACYTGLRYSDITQLKKENITFEQFDKEKIHIIRIKMHKTKLDVSIPLIPKAVKIYESEVIFTKFTNQYLNRTLKEIAQKINFDDKLTFHIARHTFATVALNRGIPIEVVSKLLGHTQIETTEIYAKVNDTYKVNQMKKML